MFDTNKFSCELCENAECKNVVCNTNANCGTNGLIDGLFCQNNNVFQNYKTFTCNNPGTTSSSCKNTITAQLQTTCLKNQICDQGQCKPVACSNNATGGTGTYTYSWTGSCTGSNSSCYTSYQAPGTYSANLTLTSGTKSKTFIVYVIVNQACTSHASQACSGNSVYWYDSCGNKQEVAQTCTANQLCENAECKNVVCNTNANCGTNGLIDGLFCQNNNVFQNYKTFTCNNPGTTSSSCKNTITAQLQTTCLKNQLCENAECKNVVCNTNANCGTNGLIDGLFCQNNNVFQNYKTFTCNNP